MRENQAIVVAACTQRIQALEEYVQQSAHIPIDGEMHKAPEVTAIYQACIDARKTLATARAEAKTARAAVAAADADRQQADKALVPWVKAQFGAESKQALAFGFGVKPRAVRSAAEKSRAAEQALATRKARGTMSKKEKAKIKGVLPEIQVSTEAQATPAQAATNGVAQPVTNGVAAHS